MAAQPTPQKKFPNVGTYSIHGAYAWMSQEDSKRLVSGL